ncbi:choice-of-anchor D domain-containing protein, partial [Streptomyces acidiscabies]
GGGRRVAVVAAAVVGVLVVGTAVAQVVGKGGGGGSSGSASVGSAGPVASVSDTESTSPPVSQSVSPSESESVSPGDSGGGGSEPPPLARAGLRLTPSAQDFGRTSRFPSVDAPLRGFLLANTGTTAVTLGSITIPGSNGFSYADGNCGTELAAGASCTITIEFSPGRIGADSGQLTVTSSARTVTADLTGTAYPSVTLTLTGGGRNQVTVSDPRGNPLCTGADDRHNCDPVEAPDSLIPTAAKGTMFSEWLGACTGSGSCSPPQDRDSEVTAVFKPDIR